MFPIDIDEHFHHICRGDFVLDFIVSMDGQLFLVGGLDV